MISAIVAAISFVTILVTTSVLIVKGSQLKKDYDNKFLSMSDQINTVQDLNTKIDEKNFDNISDVRKTYTSKDEIAREVDTKTLQTQHTKTRDIETGSIKGEILNFTKGATNQMRVNELVSNTNVTSDLNSLKISTSRINLSGNESGKGAINFGSSVNGANKGEYLLQRGQGDAKDDVVLQMPESSSFAILDKNANKSVSLDSKGVKMQDWHVKPGVDYLGLGVNNQDIVKLQKNSLFINTNNQDSSKYAFQAYNGKNEVLGIYNDGVFKTEGGNKAGWNVQFKNANNGAIMMNRGDGMGISVNTNNSDSDKYAFQAWNGKNELLGVYNDGVLKNEGLNKQGWNVEFKSPSGGAVKMNTASGMGVSINTNNQNKNAYALQAWNGKNEVLGVYNDGVLKSEGLNREGWNVNLKSPSGGGVVMNRADGYGMQINTNNQEDKKYAFQAWNGKNELLGVYNDGIIKAEGKNPTAWNFQQTNANGGQVMMNRGDGMGIHVNTNNNDKNKYALQAWNGKNEVLGVYNDGVLKSEGLNKEGWNVNLKSPSGGGVVMNRGDGYGMQINTNNQEDKKYAFQAWNGKNELLGVYNDGIIKAEGKNPTAWNFQQTNANGGRVLMNRGDGMGIHVNTNNNDNSKYALQAWNGKNELLGVYNDGMIKSEGTNPTGWNFQQTNANGGRVMMNRGDGMGVHINTNNTDKTKYALQAWNGKNELLGVYNDGVLKSQGLNTEGWNVNFQNPNGGGVVMNKADGLGMQINTNNTDPTKYGMQIFDGKREVMGVYNDGTMKVNGKNPTFWNAQLTGPNNQAIYMNHGQGLGMHINPNNQDPTKYALQVHNNQQELLGVYNDGRVQMKTRTGKDIVFNDKDGKNSIGGDTRVAGVFQGDFIKAGPDGKSVNLAPSEIKLRGDGQRHYSVFNTNGTLTINDTSSSPQMGTPGTNLLTIDPTKMTLKADSSLCIADTCVNRTNLGALNQVQALQVNMDKLQKQIASLTPQQLTTLQNQYQQQLNQTQTQINQLANQQATQQTLSIQQQIDAINRTLNDIKNKMGMPVDNIISGRIVRISQPKVTCMNIAEIQIFSTDGVTNIAKNKTVTLSSRYGNDFPGNFLVDDNTNNFAHTSCRDSPSMIIDLGQTVPITKIVVYNRVDCCRGRITGSILQIIDNNNQTVWTSSPFPSPTGGTTSTEDMNGFMTYTCVPPSPVVTGAK